MSEPNPRLSLLSVAAVVAAYALAGCSGPRAARAVDSSNATQAPVADAALRYHVEVDPGDRRLRVEGVWTGATEADVVRWALGTGADSSGVERVWESLAGLRFAYVVDVPPSQTENSLLPSLSGRRLRAWQWSLLRYPVAANGPPEGAISVRYTVPADWRAATAFGDAAQAPVRAPSLGAALRSPVLAADLRLVEVPTGGTVSRLAVRAGHPVPDSVFALGFRQLVETADAYVGGRQSPRALFAGLDLLEGKDSGVPGNFSASPEASSFFVLQHNNQPADPGFWGTIAHEYLHGWTPSAFSLAEPRPTPVEGRLWPWFREGLTSYLGYQIAHQAGLLSDDEWAEGATKYLREYQAVESGSAVTGFRAYSEGYVIGLGLDAALVGASDGDASVRDWFGLLLERHAGEGAAPLTLAAMREAARELGGDGVADLFDRLVSTEPEAVRAALLEAAGGSGLRIETNEGGPQAVLGEAVPLLDPLGRVKERRAVRARLQAAYDALGPLNYPLVPSAPIAGPRLTAFESGLASPTGGAWAPFSYGAGSETTAVAEAGALRVEGRAGSGYSGSGAELALGTPDETTDLSVFDGVEVEVADGPVVVQFLSAFVSRVDRPSAEVGETDGRVTLRFPWTAFGQRTPTPGWEANTSALQVLVRGQGEKTTAFTLYGLRLYRDLSP